MLLLSFGYHSLFLQQRKLLNGRSLHLVLLWGHKGTMDSCFFAIPGIIMLPLWVCPSNHLQKEKEDTVFYTKVKCDAQDLSFNFSLFLLELLSEQKNRWRMLHYLKISQTMHKQYNSFWIIYWSVSILSSVLQITFSFQNLLYALRGWQRVSAKCFHAVESSHRQSALTGYS